MHRCRTLKRLSRFSRNETAMTQKFLTARYCGASRVHLVDVDYGMAGTSRTSPLGRRLAGDHALTGIQNARITVFTSYTVS